MMNFTPTSTDLLLLTQTTAFPLTSVFTPPWSCTNDVGVLKMYYLSGGLFTRTAWKAPFGCFPPGPTDALPSSSTYGSAAYAYPSASMPFFDWYQLQHGYYYSPGACPDRWNYVATSTAHDLRTGGPPITLAVCCPPHMSSWAGIAGFVCEQVLHSSDTSGFWGSIFKIVDPKLLPGQTVLAQPISVAWQAADLPQFTPSAAPAVALAIQTGATSIPTFFTPAPSPKSTPTPTPSSGHTITLSRPAAIGVGVGTGVGAIILLIIVYFACCRQARNRSKKSRHHGHDRVRDPSNEINQAVPPPYASIAELGHQRSGGRHPEAGSVQRQCDPEQSFRSRAELTASPQARSIFELARSRQSSRSRAEMAASPRSAVRVGLAGL